MCIGQKAQVSRQACYDSRGAQGSQGREVEAVENEGKDGSAEGSQKGAKADLTPKPREWDLKSQ